MTKSKATRRKLFREGKDGMLSDTQSSQADDDVKHPESLETEKKDDDVGLQGDYLNVILLLFLYTLQGIPLGLSQSIDFILQEKKLSFDEQGIFSFMSWPYSLKLLWAPIVDSVFSATFGRRKSWLVPCQMLIGVLLIVLPPYMKTLLGEDEAKPRLYELTGIFFFFYLLAATQDVALDGWAVTMLARRNIGYASTCNSIGQTLGFFIAFTGFFVLEMYDLCTLESFMYFWGVIFVVGTTVVAIFKKENGSDAKKDDDMTETKVDVADDGSSLTVKETYQQMGQILGLPGVKATLILLLTRNVAFASTDNLAQRKLMQKGMKKEHLAGLTVLLTPLTIVFTGVVSKQTSNRPLDLFRRSFLPRVLVGIATFFLVLWAPNFSSLDDDAGIPINFYIAMVVIVVVHSIFQTTMFVAIMGFFAQISDPLIGGTYMTLLNTIANLGSKWPSQMVLFLVDHLTFSTCEEGEKECQPYIDGYVPVTILCTLYGLFWIYRFGPELSRLQDLPLSTWHVHSTKYKPVKSEQ